MNTSNSDAINVGDLVMWKGLSGRYVVNGTLGIVRSMNGRGCQVEWLDVDIPISDPIWPPHPSMWLTVVDKA